MKKTVFTGAGVAIVTPFLEDGQVNYPKLGELIDWQIENGTDCIVTCGTTGESAAMSHEEHLDVVRYTVKKVAGRVPVVAGAGSNDTAVAVELSKRSKEAGADALLHVTPYYNIVAVKEANGNISEIAKLFAACGDCLDVYSGNDDQIVPILSLGGKGVISVLSNVMPREAHEICQLYFDGKTAESTALQLKLLPLINALFMDVNPIPVKDAMNLMGLGVGECRLPLCSMAESQLAVLRETLAQNGLVEDR